MPLQNKNRIAYLGALTLLFSYAEMLLPRFVPFFRLGLGNVVILLALGLDFPSFLILTVIKSLAASVTNGTLLSPFFLISVGQSLASGLVMYALFKIKKNWLGLYGISLAGGAVSSLVQIGMSAVYLGSGTLTLIGPMLLFGIVASVITATLATFLSISEEAPVLQWGQTPINPRGQTSQSKLEQRGQTPLFQILVILISAILILSTDNLIILAAGFALAFAFQLISGRKIKILPHLSIWIFVIIVSLLSPNGKIWFKFGPLSITQGAFLTGLEKTLKLSAVAALSQCSANIKPKQDSILALTMNYFSAILSSFKTSEGKIYNRIASTLKSNSLTMPETSAKKQMNLPISAAMLIFYIALFITSKFL